MSQTGYSAEEISAASQREPRFPPPRVFFIGTLMLTALSLAGYGVFNGVSTVVERDLLVVPAASALKAARAEQLCDPKAFQLASALHLDAPAHTIGGQLAALETCLKEERLGLEIAMTLARGPGQ